MKKTLIALMALAGVASAYEVWTFDPSTATATSTVTSAPVTIQIDGFTQTPITTTAVTYVDGSYHSVAIPTGYDFKVGTEASTNSFTLMTYVNFSGTYYNNDKESFFFGTGDTDGGGIGLNIKNGKLSFTQKTVTHNHDEGVAIDSNTWYHVALAYDGASNKATLFVNGEKESTITLDTPANKPTGYAPPVGTNMYFGALSTNGGQDDFDGSIAQFQIVHGAALGAADIKAIAIPEPATATLSLLALAGLCARRRRK